MYILFRAESNPSLGPVQLVGDFLDYRVGLLDDSLVEVVKLSNIFFRVLPSQAVAEAYKFAKVQTNYISVKAGDLTRDEQLNSIMSSLEPDQVKTKYYLTDEDDANGAEFLKTYMRMVLDDVYDKRMANLNLGVSALEYSSWSQQRAEAAAYAADSGASVPLLTALASARGITVVEMVAKVNNAINTYNEAVAALLATKQQVEQEIKVCTTILQCQAVLYKRYGIAMSEARKAEAGITQPCAVDL